MTDGRFLLDTGPLVAYLHRDDQHHEACLHVFQDLHGTILTTEPVLTEAMHLLERVPGGQARCLEFFIRGGAVLIPLTRTTLARCNVLMAQYADVPMDFADSTLVALAEERGTRHIFTLDQRGFRTYRIGRRGLFDIVP